MDVAIVDTGPLYAAVDVDDNAHEESVEALGRPGTRLVIPAMVLAEATYLIGTRLGAAVESKFLSNLGDEDVEAPSPDDLDRMAALVERYRNFPLGGTDASVVALAERRETDLLITLDRRHFGTIRPRHAKRFRIIP
ncbi:MAG: PIN domain-containing protein [Deltaproteobacteria bacterium]|nr:PIN domain-containing protein [Deltaproteobacteria bacterium]